MTRHPNAHQSPAAAPETGRVRLRGAYLSHVHEVWHVEDVVEAAAELAHVVGVLWGAARAGDVVAVAEGHAAHLLPGRYRWGGDETPGQDFVATGCGGLALTQLTQEAALMLR